jgi:hypothetical protein
MSDRPFVEGHVYALVYTRILERLTLKPCIPYSNLLIERGQSC